MNLFRAEQILFGTLQNVKCTMVNISAPNSAQAPFLCPIASRLAQYANHPILITGDFNLVKDVVVDRSGHPLPADKALSSTFNELSLALSDSWRLLIPHSGEYTFHSKVHNSYSRINYLLLSNSLVDKVINAEIHTKVISGHFPISTLFCLTANENKTKQWRFNNSLLWYCPKNLASLNNPMIKFSISITKTLHKRLGITGASLPSCPLWKNPLFFAGGYPLNNIAMQDCNLHNVGQIIKDNNIISFFRIDIKVQYEEIIFPILSPTKSCYNKNNFKRLKHRYS